jgi:hypothetical protein
MNRLRTNPPTVPKTDTGSGPPDKAIIGGTVVRRILIAASAILSLGLAGYIIWSEQHQSSTPIVSVPAALPISPTPNEIGTPLQTSTSVAKTTAHEVTAAPVEQHLQSSSMPTTSLATPQSTSNQMAGPSGKRGEISSVSIEAQPLPLSANPVAQPIPRVPAPAPPAESKSKRLLESSKKAGVIRLPSEATKSTDVPAGNG